VDCNLFGRGALHETRHEIAIPSRQRALSTESIRIITSANQIAINHDVILFSKPET
jgi:hypothetical protein